MREIKDYSKITMPIRCCAFNLKFDSNKRNISGSVCISDAERDNLYELDNGCYRVYSQSIGTMLSEHPIFIDLDIDARVYKNSPMIQFYRDYDLYIKKLANKYHNKYPRSVYCGYEDLVGQINMIISKLYFYDYYLHNFLIEKTLYNDLQSLFRKAKIDIETDSLDVPMNDEGGATFVESLVAEPTEEEIALSEMFENDDKAQVAWEILKERCSENRIKVLKFNISHKCMTKDDTALLFELRGRFKEIWGNKN